ncbi:MAG: class I SAM-dependent methyltransferase [Acidobacteriota bacterium]
MQGPCSSLTAEILSEIGARGPIPFARFMEICLYHPRHGYYTRGLGGGGRDYVTSSGIHGAFGTLVARQVEQMWRKCSRPDPFTFVEFGPGEGRFAEDFLRAASRSRGFARALRYLLVDPSPALRARQRARLGRRTPVRVEWASPRRLESEGPFVGCLFANEVVDAFPVHRLLGTPQGPREIHVDERDGALVEVLAPPSTPSLQRFLDESCIAPEDGQEVDLNLAAPRWMAWAVGLLERGYVLIVDYGYEARGLYHPARRRGTLLAYHGHRTGEDFLRNPGEQDLTAHVDFTALARAAERAGARRLGLVSQARFLLALGALDLWSDPEIPAAPESTAVPGDRSRAARLVRALREREALKELILPQRMGERFQVLVLSAGEAPGDLSGLAAPWEGRPPSGLGRRTAEADRSAAG